MIIYNCNFENWSAKVSLKYENIIKKHSYQFQTANFLLRISFSACITDQGDLSIQINAKLNLRNLFRK